MDLTKSLFSVILITKNPFKINVIKSYAELIKAINVLNHFQNAHARCTQHTKVLLTSNDFI